MHCDTTGLQIKTFRRGFTNNELHLLIKSFIFQQYAQNNITQQNKQIDCECDIAYREQLNKQEVA